MRMAYGDALASENRHPGDIGVMSSGGITGSHDAANTRGPCVVVGRKGSYGSVYWSADPVFVIDTAYYVDRRVTDVHLRWLYYVLQAINLKGSSQDVGVPGLSREAVYALAIDRLSSFEEQRRVADFLDDQVALLDRATAAVQLRRQLVLERFRAELAASVLRPPTEGRRTRLVDLFEYERNGIWGEEPDGGPDDIPCVRVADFDRFAFRAVDAPTIRKVPFAQRAPRLLRQGDVLLEKSGGTGLNPVGCAVLYESDTPAVCSNFIAALRPKVSVNATYAGFILAACYQTRRNGPFVNQTTGIQNLDSGAYLRLAIGVPERDEQAARVDRIFSARATSEAALSHLSRQGELLQERKQALITAAVTCELDVATASARSVA